MHLTLGVEYTDILVETSIRSVLMLKSILKICQKVFFFLSFLFSLRKKLSNHPWLMQSPIFTGLSCIYYCVLPTVYKHKDN